MEHAHATEAAAPVAAPAVVPVASEGVVLSMQRTVGNRAVCRAIASGMLARDDAIPTAGGAITGLSVAPSASTMPLESGTTITATVTPAGTGAKLSVEADTAAPAAGTKIDDATGKVTLDAKQPGGMMKVKAKAANDATAPFRVIEKPKEIARTAASATGTYEATFTHTFSSSGASTAGLNQGNINEKFDSLESKTPFGTDFKLKANKAGSKGWLLDSSGTMNLPDNVSLSPGVNASPFVKNASNPKPAASLPQGFDMTQKFHFKTLPSGNLEDAPFTTTTHGRHLVEDGGKLKIKLSAGTEKVLIDYAGPPVYRNASADKTTVEASAPKPKTGTWKQNKVQCKVDVEPSGGAVTWSISSSDKLGCSVDSTGEVKIGDKAGSITVRAGDGKHFDEVTITITAPAGAKPTSEEGAGDAAPAMEEPVEPTPPQDQATPPATA